MTRDGEEIKISCHQIPTAGVQEEILSSTIQQQDINLKDQTQTQSEKNESKTHKEKPKFGPPLDFDSSSYNFKEELSRLPFTVNMGDEEMGLKQQKWFLNLIYDHQTVFSLHNEDLGLCDQLKHTILTTTDKPIYLPHQTIPVQLQMEVWDCLDTWLWQGIIRPSHSPYASQVVIVQKKLGEIQMCIDFRALNTIIVHDSFPLPHIEEALQAVKVAV